MNNKPFPVSLAPQTKELYSNYDLSKKDKEEVVNKYINTLVCDELKEISDKWFVEYSVLATTIDPYRNSGNVGQLRCYSFIHDNEDTEDGKLTFKDKIERYVSPIIGFLKNKAGDNNWWFHNPETFIAPKNIDPYVSFTNNEDKIGTTVVEDIKKIADKRITELKEAERYKGEKPFYFSSLEYSRTFGDILRYSKALYNTLRDNDPSRLDEKLINHYHDGVEEARLYYDKLIADKDETFCYLTFPIVASPARFKTPEIYQNTFGDVFLNERYQGLGHCFIYFNIKDFQKLKEEDFKERVKSLFKKINTELHNFAFNYTFNLGLELQAKARNEAEKSAKAAIMSRNMSHNIGSHVMSYLKQHLGSVKDIIADGILSDLINGESELAKKLENTTENTTLPFLMGLGHFISYLQERQDFIATIATDYIPYLGNVNFKDSIYDELNPDKRAKRHSDRKNGTTDNILLGNIARSEGLGRQTCPTHKKIIESVALNDIILKFRDHFDGDPVVELDANGRIVRTINEDAERELNEMRKYDFSLPGGIVGRQAFFSIMENIIRNAAKHGSWRNKKNLVLTFDIFSTKQNDINRLNEYYNNDNVDDNSLSLKEVITNFYMNAIDSKDLYFITITDNCTVASKEKEIWTWNTLGKLRSALVSDYITNTGEMDGTNKGLKEMRVSAAWMRSIKDESECFEPYSKVADPELLNNDRPSENGRTWKVQNTEKKAPLLYARISAKRNRRGLMASNLQYILCVQIPKKVAVILKDDDDLLVIKSHLEKINWRAYTKQEFLDEKNKSYEFILIDDKFENLDDTYCEIRSRATARTFRFSDIEGLERESFICQMKKPGYDGNTDFLLLYQALSNCQENEQIVVDDKIVSDRKSGVKTSDNSIVVCDGYTGMGPIYIYRRHHEADIEFTSFMDSVSKGLKVSFVEGITGNNSTDRLVRNETLDKLWFYRHLHAMKQRVAIFDERLFHKITGLEEKDLNNEDVKLSKDNSALAFLQKGVYPFTFVQDEKDSKCYKVKGIYFEGMSPVFKTRTVKEDPQSPIKTYRCKCGTLATLSYNDGELQITPSAQGQYMKKLFEFITIHQGLLDKLYEKFNIKENKEAKNNLTNRIFEEYSCQSALHNKFLPGMIIHSGRSKPNKEEMPQKLPFIQYAALDHAVMDCKYALVELLDFARYED